MITVLEMPTCVAQLLTNQFLCGIGLKKDRVYIKKNGVRVPLDSDFPGETLNPFYGMYAAETCQTPEGKPEDGWHPEQCLTREEVLYAYTVESAYAGFEEHIKEQIVHGMLADFIIISNNILTISSKALLSLKVEQTYVGGHLVYSMNEDRAP
jgi:predicted amidohydrolase YtcJ